MKQVYIHVSRGYTDYGHRITPDMVQIYEGKWAVNASYYTFTSRAAAVWNHYIMDYINRNNHPKQRYRIKEGEPGYDETHSHCDAR